MRQVIKVGSWVRFECENHPFHGFTGRVHRVTTTAEGKAGMRCYDVMLTAYCPTAERYFKKDINVGAKTILRFCFATLNHPSLADNFNISSDITL